METLAERNALPNELFRSIFLFKLFHLPFGWGYAGTGGVDGLGTWAVRPNANLVVAAGYVFLLSGLFSVIGLFARASLLVFAISFFYVQSYIYSFNDFHHPEGVMLIMIAALALSLAGAVLSVDNILRGKSGSPIDLNATSDSAGWAIKMMQWFFVLMYLSAF